MKGFAFVVPSTSLGEQEAEFSVLEKMCSIAALITGSMASSVWHMHITWGTAVKVALC